ncbi:MAG TPA: response regulator transcription factor [Nitrospiraceae bacterium]|nr:response regulator transcription factor [Nitrospiraceae bacterium]
MGGERADKRRVRTLMVDDHTAFLDELTHLLEEDREMDVVGRATSGEDALQQTTALQPDLVLMDLAMPGMGGLEATRRLKINAGTGAPRVIVLSLHDHAMYQMAALDAGANGFVPKSKLGTMLLPLIHSIFPAATAGTVSS